MRSLAAKMMLAFLGVGLTGSLLVALLVGWQTVQQFERYILERYEEEVAGLTAELQRYYQRTGSWEGIDVVAIREKGKGGGYRSHEWQPVTLVNDTGVTVSDSPLHQRGEQLPPSALRGGVPIMVGEETVGWLLLDFAEQHTLPPPGSPERIFLTNVGWAALWSALAAVALALGLGWLLAHTIARPVQELTAATQVMARGKLGEQVPVRTRDELGALSLSFNQMSADLARAVNVRRQMTMNIAHDLRTPLSALLGYTEALHEGKFHGSPEIYGVLHQESLHLQRLVEDLRILSLADAGELPLHPQPTPPLALLERVALAHGAQATAQQVTLTVEAKEPLPLLNVDPERMVQVLGNLLHNALRYTPSHGRVTLWAEGGPEQVRLGVADTGSGIAADDLPHIWERLYRGDKARSQQGSSGLGLAIVRSIVEAHGGTVSVASQPGQGATFTIALPTSAG